MIQIKNLTVKNFMSVGNATQGIDFDRQDLTLVLGENLDLGGDGSRNGTGKTTIINALSYALYGQALTNIRKDNLINKTNGKNMLVSLDFAINGTVFKVERGRKPNLLKFYVNNEEQAADDNAQGDSRETQEAIERSLGMTHDMFKHVLALNTYTEPFLSLKANDQRAIIEQLLGITMLSERAEKIKELNRSTKDLITQEEFRIRAEQEANKRIEEQIESFKRRQVLWQKKHDSDLAYLVAQYDEMSKLDIEKELLAHKDLAVWSQLKQQKETYDSVVARQTSWQQKHDLEVAAARQAYADKNRINIETELVAWTELAAYNQRVKDIGELEKLIARCVADEAKEQKVIDKLKAEIEELKNHKCYACGQDFHDTSHEIVLAAKEKALQEAALQALSTNSQWIEHTDALLKLSELGDKPVTHYKTEAEAIRHSSELNSLKQTLDSKQSEVNPFTDQLSELHDVVVPAIPSTHYDKESQAIEHRSKHSILLTQITSKNEEADPYSEQIAEMQGQALQEVNYEELNRLSRLQEHQDFLLKLLTNKDSFIRKKIIEQNLSYLNSRLTWYLDRIGLPHQVVFQNDLTVEITELGRDLDFDNLSRGERNRLILSMSWAFRDVWESLYHPINVLFIDELIDSGMDTAGMESSLALLKKMSRERHKSIWLVSHRDELAGRVENILRVVKENGFTSYNTDIEMA
jgi:DNA repair exonuclease SbcCD ATPase subunit